MFFLIYFIAAAVYFPSSNEVNWLNVKRKKNIGIIYVSCYAADLQKWEITLSSKQNQLQVTEKWF